MSWRRLRVLVKHLPPESATVAALRGGAEYRSWDPATYAAADTRDLLVAVYRRLVQVTSKGSAPDLGPPFPRPGTPEPTPEDAAAAAERADEDDRILFVLSGGRAGVQPA